MITIRIYASRIAFLKAAIAYYASFGITVSRVMIDNGSYYRVKSLRQSDLKSSIIVERIWSYCLEGSWKLIAP